MIVRIVSLLVLLGVVGGCTPEEPEARPSSKPPDSHDHYGDFVDAAADRAAAD